MYCDTSLQRVMEMYDQTRFFHTGFSRRLLLVAALFATVSGMTAAYADDASGVSPVAPLNEQPTSKNPVFDGAQAIRNMVKSIGPEAAMDMMFSSIDPVCQKTLLSKTTDKSKAPVNADDMRDNKYLQPAIATADQAALRPKAAPDSRSQPVFNWMDPKNYWGWLRMDKVTTETQKTAPIATPPKRY